MIISRVEFEGMANDKKELCTLLINAKKGHPNGWRVSNLEVIPTWDAFVVLSHIEKIPEDE